ncbi:diguanylate cyclase [Paucibacter sp. B2R-40]|uniref:ligand-binding sensor domain-containing diguanylate cyclase n=1 Tax=Paucibacter sp. B2R-40 TaxID=2893554 RepID=UPI0021E50E3E|nr:ligand-binding sensor domain-containing diguanylate cyclase [Paucibacter sp. B2R-40]MCV2353556.1 diguanylate cyclase [Paucibacter sp. B2R-40]
MAALPALGGSAAASLAEARFESVGADAIPRGVVASLAQDKAGFIWVATGDGLVRYDGYRFRPQERASKIAAARNLGWLRALLPARDGRLWIGTETDGLAVYDPLTEQVSSFRFEHEAPAANPNSVEKLSPLPTIRALAEDVDGSIWLGTLGGGLHRFDPHTQTFSHYRHSAAAGSLDDARVQSLLVDRQGTLWVGTWSGLSRFDRASQRFEPILQGLAGQRVQALLQASNGQIWAGTQRGSLAVMDPQTGQGKLLGDDEQGAGGPIAGRGEINSLIEATSGQIWVGHAGGIDVHDLRSRRLQQRMRHDPRKPAGLAGDEVVNLWVDRAGWVWVGGFGLGLQRHNPNNHSIWVRGAGSAVGLVGGPTGDLKKPDVRSLLSLKNGELLAAGHDGQVARLDAGLRVVGGLRPRLMAGSTQGKEYAALSPAAQLEAARITSMAQMPDGKIWLGAEGLLYQFDAQDRQLRSLHLDAGKTRRLLAGSDGSLWIGADDGLHVLRPGAAKVQRLARPGGQALTGEIHVMAEAPDRALWVGSMRGLFRLAAEGSELQRVASPAGAELANPVVLGLLFDSKQTLWVDTAVAGLHRMKAWDGRQASFERISERHGIVNRPFGANLLEDGRGRIWTQMNVYDPVSDRLDELTPTDGLDIGTPWFFSFAKAADGRFLFGGSKGIAVVSPDQFDRSRHAPPLVVSELRINGERQQAGQLQDGLRLSPQQRSFSLEFAALDYSNPGRSRYAYKLEGFDPDWIATGADLRVASYSNLSPGDYVLRVRAHNRSGVASEQELAIPVKVLPAWWQQWWFRVVLLALLAAAVAALVRSRTRLLRQRQVWLENKVRERTAALEASSLTDPLTGLRNRRFLAQQIESDVALTLRRNETPRQGAALEDGDMIFFLVDIDHFKQINDELGHAAGDAVLRQMRGRLASVFRDSDYLVRWGGEEFLIVARETSRRHAADLAERACRAIAEQPFVLDDGSSLSKTCSLGFACFPLAPQAARAVDWNATVNLADAALLAVKRAGRKGWLGVLSAPGASVQGLTERTRQPMAGWLASGELELVGSAVQAAQTVQALDGTDIDPSPVQ